MKHLSWNSEWRYYGFGEQFYMYEGFRAHIFMTGLQAVPMRKHMRIPLLALMQVWPWWARRRP